MPKSTKIPEKPTTPNLTNLRKNSALKSFDDIDQGSKK